MIVFLGGNHWFDFKIYDRWYHNGFGKRKTEFKHEQYQSDEYWRNSSGGIKFGRNDLHYCCRYASNLVDWYDFIEPRWFLILFNRRRRCFLSGFLGLLVKIVGDSISHAVTSSGYGALLHQVGVREVSEQKKEHDTKPIPVLSEPEWTDSDGHKWKKLAGQLYWWNGSGWQRHN